MTCVYIVFILVLLEYLISGEGWGTEMVGSLSCLFSSTSTVMVCWSSSRTRSSSWVLKTQAASYKKKNTQRKWNAKTHTRGGKTGLVINTDIRFSLPPTHHTQECLMLWKHTTSECLWNKLIHFVTLDSDSPPIMAKRLGVPPEDRGITVSKSNMR